MVFWLFDVENDQLLGLFGRSSQLNKRIVVLLYLVFWIVNVLITYFFQSQLVIKASVITQEQIITSGALLLFVLVAFLVLLHYRTKGLHSLYTQRQVVPEQDQSHHSKYSTNKSKFHLHSENETVHQYQSNIGSAINSKQHNIPQPPPSNKSFLASSLLCTLLLVLHANLLLYEIMAKVHVEASTLPSHTLALILFLSSIPLNFFTTISMLNLLVNLLLSKALFIQYVVSQYQGTPKFHNLLWNVYFNFTEFFLLSLNTALFVGSFIGFIIINDTINILLFFLYIVIIALYIIYKLFLAFFRTRVSRN